MADARGIITEDGNPVVECAHMNLFSRLIANGMHVHTAKGDYVGKIKRFDPATGGMLVKHGEFAPYDLYIPITVVKRVEVDTREVYLSVSTEDLQRIEGSEPAAILFVEAQEAGAT